MTEGERDDPEPMPEEEKEPYATTWWDRYGYEVKAYGRRAFFVGLLWAGGYTLGRALLKFGQAVRDA